MKKRNFLVSLIVARTSNGLIGVDNGLPWKCQEDLAIFKRKTKGKIVVMGRKTYESIGKPLPDRVSVIMSNTMKEYPSDIIVTNNIEEIFKLAEDLGKDIFIIGGSEIFNLFEEHIDYYHITEIKGDYGSVVNGIYYKKEFPKNKNQLVSKLEHEEFTNYIYNTIQKRR